MDEMPRLLVAVLVFIRQGDAILLVKQNYGQQYWSLPGGVVERGESIDQAAVREVKEETGLDIQVKRVIGIYSKPDEGSIAISMEAEVAGGQLRPDHEIGECAYFQMDRLPAPIREHLVQRVEDYRQDLPYALLRSQ